MRKTLLTVLLLALPAFAKPVTKNVSYTIDKVTYEGVFAYDDAAGAKPGLLLVPNWLGINEANLKQAQEIAARGYTVFVADMYGKTARPKNQEEAGKMSGVLKGDRALVRKRVTKAFEVMKAEKGMPIEASKLGAIGFCFGGLVALELGRTGAALGGISVFHSALSSPKPEDGKNIKARVLAMQGADDPYVPAEEVKGFEDEMRAAKLDWQLVRFGNTVHSYTDVDARMAGQAEYNPLSAKRAYLMMDNFFAETFTAAAAK